MPKTLHQQIQDYNRARANLTGLTPEYVQSLIQASPGSALQQSKLFETIISRDSEVRGAVSQRVQALKGGEWNIVPAKKDGKTKPTRAGKKLAEALKVRGLRRSIAYLGYAPLFGYAAVEIVYATDKPGVPVELRPVPYAALDVSYSTMKICLDGKWYDIDGDKDLENRLIILKNDVNDPAGSAVLRSVVGPWLVKFYALQDWAIYTEKLGTPPLIGKYKPGIPGETEEITGASLVLSQLEDLGSNAYVAIPWETVEIEMLKDARLDASKSFDLLLDRCDRWMKRAILTSESTMQSGAEGQGARAADTVRAQYGLETIIQADGDDIAECLQEQFVDRIGEFMGYPPKTCEVSVSWLRELQTMESILAACQLKNAGFTFEEEEILTKLGFTYREPEENELLVAGKPNEDKDTEDGDEQEDEDEDSD